MAFISAGYDGTVDEVQFARMIPKAGTAEYGIANSDDFNVTAIANQSRTVNISTGTAWGRGVLDVMDANVTKQLDTVSSGSRWDLIALRRDWQPPGGNTSVVVIPGGSSKALPDRNWNGGVIDDQPLALVRVQANSSAIAEIIDLRVWARNGGCTANSDLVRSYLNNLGTVLEVNGTVWRRKPGDNNTPKWVDDRAMNDTGWVDRGLSIPVANKSWRLDGYKLRHKNGDLWAFLNFTYTNTSVITANSGGNISDTKVATLPAGYRPRGLSPWPVTVQKPGVQEWFGRLEGDGSLVITHGLPNATIRLGDNLRLIVHCPLD